MLMQMILYGTFLIIFVFVIIQQLNISESSKQRLVGQNIQDISFLLPRRYFDYAADPNGNLDNFDYYVSFRVNMTKFASYIIENF